MSLIFGNLSRYVEQPVIDETGGGGHTPPTGDPGGGGDETDCFDGPSGIEIIIWDAVAWSTSALGHASAIINGVSLSWEGNGMNKDSNPSNYIDKRSQTSSGTGYVLDFGSKEINDKFKAAYDKAYDGAWVYGPYNNCSDGFVRAMNQIVFDLNKKGNKSLPTAGSFTGIAPNTPSKDEKYIKKNLKQYTKCVKRYNKNSIPIINYPNK